MPTIPPTPPYAPGPAPFKGDAKVNNKNKTFAPGITLNFNTGNTASAGPAVPITAAGSGTPLTGAVLLPPPEFNSPAQVRNYCNALRAAAVTLSIEVAMGAEILKAVLSAVPDPEGRLGAARIRAHKVARKLNKAADALRDAAKSGAGTYSAFQQQYEEEINRVRHRARRPSTPRMDWAQQ